MPQLIYLVVFISAVVLAPFAVLWSLNTLFFVSNPIPYDFWTWLAVVVLNLTWAYKPTKVAITKGN